MPQSRNPIDIDFDGPATYRIIVKGRIDKRHSEYLGGMCISTQNCKGGAIVTMLTGKVKDQAELAGIVDSIYEMHLPILSVLNVTEENDESARFQQPGP